MEREVVFPAVVLVGETVIDPRKLVEFVTFDLSRRIRGFEVSEAPSFDPEGLSYFRQRIRSAAGYLEYGTGGSTFEASRLGVKMKSVESDPFFLKAVQKKVGQQSRNCEFIYADIGLTTKWGYPLLKTHSPERIRRWRNYAEAPWRPEFRPDLILIDGRFRVLCALMAIKRLAEFEILLDDYAGCDHYRAVEEFARLDRMHGRMAVSRPKAYDADKLDQVIESFSSDYR